jgi:tRNA(Ile2) C34 agmatinyltransferase TiaS
MKHEHCGGELRKFGTRGRYRCAKCRKHVNVGHAPLVQRTAAAGYVKRQQR